MKSNKKWDDVFEDMKKRYINSLKDSHDGKCSHHNRLSSDMLLKPTDAAKRKERIERRIKQGLKEMLDCRIGDKDDQINEEKKKIHLNYILSPRINTRSLLLKHNLDKIMKENDSTNNELFDLKIQPPDQRVESRDFRSVKYQAY